MVEFDDFWRWFANSDYEVVVVHPDGTRVPTSKTAMIMHYRGLRGFGLGLVWEDIDATPLTLPEDTE